MLAKHIQIAALLALVQGSVLCRPAAAQDADVRGASRLVSREEGQAIAQAALQHWPQIRDKPDCSHLVHDLYAEVGLDYEYATTNDIFDGVESFRRVRNPQPGDLVVWQGHVGIVIDPEDNSFYSSVISGFSVSSYSSSYWESRGPRRFYRYRISDAQSARLLNRVVYRNPRPVNSMPKTVSSIPKPVRKASLASKTEPEPVRKATLATKTDPEPVRKASLATKTDPEEDDLPDADPVTLHETGATPPNSNRIAGPRISLARAPSREETRSAFTKLSDVEAAELQQRSALEGRIAIVDGFEVGRIETQGSFGWAELKIRQIAVLAGGKLISINRTEKLRLPLLRETDGWALQGPPNNPYLLRSAAVRLIAARIAALSRNPEDQKELKPLTRALATLLADDRS